MYSFLPPVFFSFFFFLSSTTTLKKNFFFEHRFKTKTVKKCLDPEFQERFIMKNISIHDLIEFNFFDWDSFSFDDKMGHFDINVQDLMIDNEPLVPLGMYVCNVCMFLFINLNSYLFVVCVVRYSFIYLFRCGFQGERKDLRHQSHDVSRRSFL